MLATYHLQWDFLTKLDSSRVHVKEKFEVWHQGINLVPLERHQRWSKKPKNQGTGSRYTLGNIPAIVFCMARVYPKNWPQTVVEIDLMEIWHETCIKSAPYLEILIFFWYFPFETDISQHRARNRLELCIDHLLDFSVDCIFGICPLCPQGFNLSTRLVIFIQNTNRLRALFKRPTQAKLSFWGNPKKIIPRLYSK